MENEKEVIDLYKEHKFHLNGLGFFNKDCSSCFSKKMKMEENKRLMNNKSSNLGDNHGWQVRDSFDGARYNLETII